MRSALLLALALTPMFAAVDGTVLNSTTGKPQPGVAVNLIAPGQGGMQTVGSAKTDDQGKFRIDKNVEGAHLVQAVYAGVPYNTMINPGSPTTGLQLSVFDPTTDPASAKIAQHIVFLQPATEGLTVNEVFFVNNETKKTFNNTKDGALRFYVAGHTTQDAGVRVSINAPGGMPVQRPAEATDRPGVYKVSYPVKPGETQFNIAYTLPASEKFTGRTLQKVETRLVVPVGVTLEGDGITPMGNDPSGRAALYGLNSDGEYSVKIAGTASATSAGSSEGSASGEEDTGAPQIAQVKPRVYAQLPVVLALAIGVLLLGFIVLYRSSGASSNSAESKGKARR